MSQQDPSAGRAPRGEVRDGTPARLALAVFLLAIIAVGLRAAVPAPALNGPFRHDGLAVGIALEAVLGALLIALAVRNSRAPREAILAAKLRRLLTYVVLAGLVAIPVVYLLSRASKLHVRPRPAQPVRPSKPSVLPHALQNHGGGHLVLLILVALIAAAIACGIVWLIRNRHRFWLGWRSPRASVAVATIAEEDEAELLEAVESGQSALRLLDDARAAIIACYVAMEESLDRAGTARSVADTPDELLARAAGQGLVRTDAAARLTALFYEARFSTHPMPPGQRDEARQALDELAASLRDLTPEAVGPPAADGTGR
jgi:hypothetical protein